MPNGLLYRHNASLGPDNKHPLLIMEREEALRALRLIRAGKRLIFTARLDVDRGGPYKSFNVIGEIRGREKPTEIVLIGAHLDSWGLGTGANDNGCNVALVIDLARQIKRLGVLPRQSRAEVDKLMQTTDLGAQMKSMGMWKDWEAGRRGIKD